MSFLCRVGRVLRTTSIAITIAVAIAFCMGSPNVAFAATCSGSLLPGGSATTDLLINSPCTVVGLPGSIGVYVFHNVNIVAGGSLTFDDTRIDFHAESIIVENRGTLSAGTVLHPIGMNPPIKGEVGARVRIYLWGPSNDKGALCNGALCGVPSMLWNSNTTLMTHTVPMPKNMACVKASSIDPSYKLPGDDCFYGYDTFDAADKGKAAYFGHKVLALSYGGTIQLLGMKGATYDPTIDADPGNTGTSWVRLNGTLSKGATSLSLSRAVDWAMGDQIVVTTTDYMPTHSEQLTIATVSVDKKSITFTRNSGYPNVPCDDAGNGVCFPHNGQTYALTGVPTGIGPTQDSHITCSSGTPPNTRCLDTRAAVGLLTRSIEILSYTRRPVRGQVPEPAHQQDDQK